MYIQYGVSKWLFLIEIPFKNKKLQQSVYCCDFRCLFIEFAAVSSYCGITFIWHWKTSRNINSHNSHSTSFQIGDYDCVSCCELMSWQCQIKVSFFGFHFEV
jgi:hypothetical protein